jgi:hypothetical protein
MAINLALTEQDNQAVQAVLPAVRRTSPEAAPIISRLLRAAAGCPPIVASAVAHAASHVRS